MRVERASLTLRPPAAGLLAAAIGLGLLGLDAGPGRADDAVAARLTAEGDSLRALGLNDEARGRYEAALEENDGDCGAHYGLARLFLGWNDASAAEKHVRECERRDECKDQGAIARALLLLESGDLDQADATLYKPNAETLSNPLRLDLERAFVALYREKGYPSMELDHLDEVMARSRPDAELFLRKGRLLNELKRYNDALEAFKGAVAEDPRSELAYEEIVDLYTRANRPARAAATLDALARVRGDAESHLKAARALAEAGRLVDARDAYERATVADSDAVAAWLELGRIRFQAGDGPGALDAYARCGESAPLEATDHLNIGRARLEREDFEGALAACERAAELDSTLANAHFYAGYVHFSQEQYREAIPHFERAVALDSTAVPALINLGTCCLQAGQPERGFELLRRAVSLRPDDLDTRLYLAQALAGEQKWSSAISEYRSLLETDPENADALRGLGYCYLYIDRYAEAVSVLHKANRIDPDNVQGLTWLAQGYGLQNDLAKSEALFRKVLKLDPNSREARDGLSQILESQ